MKASKGKIDTKNAVLKPGNSSPRKNKIAGAQAPIMGKQNATGKMASKPKC